MAGLLVASSLWLWDARCSLAQDHLEPERSTVHSSAWQVVYHDNIRRYLVGETRGRPMAHMICLQSLSNEWAISVVDGGGTYLVESAVAQHRVRQSEAFRPNHRFKADRDQVEAVVAKIQIRRVSRPIDEATAKAIHALWFKMLLDVRYPREDLEFMDDVVDYYHFSSYRPGRGTLTGQVHSPWEMTASSKLAKIGELLRSYAECPEADRAKVLAAIREKVQQMDKSLGKAQER